MKTTTFIRSCAAVFALSSSLFLFACKETTECKHTDMTMKDFKPTHEDEGYFEYSCADCDSYSYKTRYAPPLGHSMNTTVTPPTCTSEGYTNYICDCGYQYTSDFVAPTGHSYKTELIAARCDTEGYTLYTCECGYVYKSNYVQPLGHTFSKNTVKPTCDTEGYTVADCSACGMHYTYDIKSPLGHDLNATYGYVSVDNRLAQTHYTCNGCDLDYYGDFLFYKDVYHGAYVENTKVLSKGIDVSKWNHNVAYDGSYLPLDWKAIKSQGYDFVILRAGYMGSGNTFVPDPVFEMDYIAAKAAGLNVGAYIYSYAYTIADARAEAEAMIKALKGKQFEYPIFFDIEYSDEKIVEKGLTPRMITDICTEFISTMQKNGYFSALYTNNKWLTEYFIKNEVTQLFDIWYARYLYSADDGKVVNEATWNTEKYGTQMPMWQFSETGTIDGFVANDGKNTPIYFDKNYCYKDYPSLIKQYGLNGFGETKNLSNLDGLYSEGI